MELKVGSTYKCIVDCYAKHMLERSVEYIDNGEQFELGVIESSVLIIGNTEDGNFFVPIEQFKVCFTEVEDRYHIRPKGVKLEGDLVLNYVEEVDKWLIENDADTFSYEASFTIKRLRQLGLNPDNFDLIPVEEE